MFRECGEFGPLGKSNFFGISGEGIGWGWGCPCGTSSGAGSGVGIDCRIGVWVGPDITPQAAGWHPGHSADQGSQHVSWYPWQTGSNSTTGLCWQQQSTWQGEGFGKMS
jgi:hypothetical protein